MANQTTLVERIEARVQREDSGQIAVGTHVLRIGSVHGGIVDEAATRQQPRPKARPVPIELRPRPFPAILDRNEERAAAIRALESLQSVELFGEAGIGKTVVLRHLAYTINSKLFQDGIIYREIRGVPPDDVLQLLWGDFFECGVPFKPTDSQLRHDLQSKNALVILDAAELTRTEAERVMNVAAACTFLLGSPERHLWGSEAHATPLAGLPAKDVKTLIERELSRPLTADEALIVEPITVALKGNPLRILQEAAMARLNDRSLTSLAQDLRSDGSPEKLAEHITAPLSSVQRRILSALAIFNGAPVQATTLGELLQIDDVENLLEELEERHLVRTHASFRRPQRMGATAGFAEEERAEFHNRPLAAKLTQPLQTPIQFAFLSYAREDAEFVLHLAKDLRTGGAGVWVDQLDIAPGQRWDRAVEDALAKCLQLVVILSPAAVESTNVMDEVSLALEDGKTVVPVLHRQCKIPFRLRRLQYVDLSLDYKAGHDRLLETLGAGALGTANVSGLFEITRGVVEQSQARARSVRAHPTASAPEKPEDAVDARRQRRYTLAGEFALFMPERTETTEERKRAVAYFAAWVGPRQRDVKTILETLPVLMHSLRWGVKFGMAADVMRITRSLELALVLTGRWESWSNALCLAAQSAIAAGDKDALGWVRHQDGTKAICEGNFSEARQSLEQALQIREELRDKAGAGITRRNLKLVAPPTIPTWKHWKLVAGFGAIICTVIVAMAFASKFRLWSPSVTSVPAVTSTAQTAPPSATSAPTVASMTTTAPPSATSAPTVASMATTAPPSATSAPTVASMATTAPPSATSAPTVIPTEITTPLPVTPVGPSIIPPIFLNPPPPVRIVRFTGPPTIVRGERATLSYRLENAERASIDPSFGEIGPTEGDVSVSPQERTTYTLTAFGRDGATQRQRITINIRPQQNTGPTRETQKKRQKGSPSPGPTRETQKKREKASPGPGPYRRVPSAATPTPRPRLRIQIGIGRGYTPP
jgi:Flp pilus assembly protein TadD